MKFLLVFIIFFSTQLNAATFKINLKEIIKAPSYYGPDQRVFTDFEIVKVEALAVSSTTKSSLKFTGCYASKYRNSPRIPFSPKYIYTAKNSIKLIDTEHDSDKSITVFNFEEKVSIHSEKFDHSLPRKCKVTKAARILVMLKLGDGSKEKYEVNLELTKKGFKYLNPVLPRRVSDVFAHQELFINNDDTINLGFSQSNRDFK